MVIILSSLDYNFNVDELEQTRESFYYATDIISCILTEVFSIEYEKYIQTQIKPYS